MVIKIHVEKRHIPVQLYNLTGGHKMGSLLSLKCRKLVIRQGFEGSLEGPQSASLRIDNHTVVKVSQLGKRFVEISSDIETTINDLFLNFQEFEKFLMLFDGRFFEIEELDVYGENGDAIENSAEVLKEMQKKRLKCFNSNRIFVYPKLKLSSFGKVVSEGIYKEWLKLVDDIELAHNMYLYAISDNGMTSDINFAFLVELAEPYAELIKDRKGIFYSTNMDKRATLAECLESLMLTYGGDIYQRELNNKWSSFIQTSKNSRVKIMHIKKNQGNFYDRNHCVFYSMKLHLLYRRILLELIGVPYDCYRDKLQAAVKLVDARLDDIDRKNT